MGSHIVERLVAQGYQVRALARKTSDIGHLRSTGVEIVFGDIEDRNSLPPEFSSATCGYENYTTPPVVCQRFKAVNPGG